MKNHTKSVCMFVLFALLGCFGNLSAQNTSIINYDDIYVVKPGDSAWLIAGDVWENPMLWRKVVEKNPFLAQKGRITVNPQNGWTYVMMRPGEQLFGLQELGITPPKPTPINELGFITPPIPTIWEQIPDWFWWMLLIAFILAILVWLANRNLNQDAATSGIPVVPNGVTATTAGIHFQQVAAFRAGNSVENSARPNVYQDFTVLEQIAGRIWGVLNVSYADGKSVPRRLNGDRAFRARVRFPGGQEETLYMLQACGNDLRYGGISRYLPGPEFRFEADPVQAPTPTTEPAPQPAAQTTPEPAAQTAPTPEPAQPAPAPELTPAPQTTGVTTFEFKRANNGQPNMVRLQGIEAEEFSFSVGPDGTTLRYRETKEGQPTS